MPLDFTDDRPPLPPLDLIQHVVNPFAVEDARYVREAFDTYPPVQLRELERALRLTGREFDEFERLLDFGCGPGRYLRHLGRLSSTTEIYGADIDEQSVAWLSANVPYGRFAVIPEEPPTEYDAGYFDLVINHSVFTHLDSSLQDRWLAELHRITRPGGVLMLTIHSLPQWNQALSEMAGAGEDAEQVRAQLEREGVLFVADDHFIGSTHPDSYHTAFHAPWYVFEHWTTWFDLVAYVPCGSYNQDLVVMRRAPDDAERPRPIGHGGTKGGADAPPPSDGSPLGRLEAVLDALESRLAADAHRSSRAAPWRSALQSPRLDQQRVVSGEIVAVLRDLRDELARHGRLITERDRQLAMLRAGLYEQGVRISVVAEQLRDDLRARP